MPSYKFFLEPVKRTRQKVNAIYLKEITILSTTLDGTSTFRTI